MMTDDIEMCDKYAKTDHCALHRLLWEHNENDRREHRTDLCNKLLVITNSITTLVPRWVYILTTTAGFAFSIILFGWIITIVTKGQESLTTGQKEIIVTMNNIENTQIKVLDRQEGFDTALKQLNERQNFLRDQNIKILENQKK
jgi:uncharacterized membrane protein (DUF106 family)